MDCGELRKCSLKATYSPLGTWTTSVGRWADGRKEIFVVVLLIWVNFTATVWLCWKWLCQCSHWLPHNCSPEVT